ncbi:hypothetical protein ACFVFJ_47755 [Streptomyces sp. NPDC057717]|uniref:hypothetical protein n=1 Tax=Streptomyces sp. NPDC057717 TaxID=3346224 RepID=UPI00367B119B
MAGTVFVAVHQDLEAPMEHGVPDGRRVHHVGAIVMVETYCLVCLVSLLREVFEVGGTEPVRRRGIVRDEVARPSRMVICSWVSASRSSNILEGDCG